MTIIEGLMDGSIEPKLVITTNSWFYGSDGNQYQAVWGTVTLLEADKVAGFKVKTGDANYLFQVGVTNPVFIMGCQAHYFAVCEKAPISTNVLCLD